MATSITPAEIEALLAPKSAPVLLDVRRQAAYEAAQDQIAGASWRDPSRVDSWATVLP